VPESILETAACHIGHHVEIAVAEFPIGILESGNGRHLHVNGEQVVTGMCPLRTDVADKERCVETLPVNPAVVISERHYDRVDFVGLRQGAKRLEIKHSTVHGHGCKQ